MEIKSFCTQLITEKTNRAVLEVYVYEKGLLEDYNSKLPEYNRRLKEELARANILMLDKELL